jgi:hypothetical protein
VPWGRGIGPEHLPRVESGQRCVQIAPNEKACTVEVEDYSLER